MVLVWVWDLFWFGGRGHQLFIVWLSAAARSAMYGPWGSATNDCKLASLVLSGVAWVLKDPNKNLGWLRLASFWYAFDFVLVWFRFGFGMVVVWCWHGFGKVLAWLWHGSGMVLALFWHGFDKVLPFATLYHLINFHPLLNFSLW